MTTQEIEQIRSHHAAIGAILAKADAEAKPKAKRGCKEFTPEKQAKQQARFAKYAGKS